MPIYNPHMIARIVALHRLKGEPVLLPNFGMMNEAWRVGDAVIRLPLGDVGEKDAGLEAEIVPLGVAAGMKTPRLIAYDGSRSLFHRAFTVFERATGEPFGTLDMAQEEAQPLIRTLADEIFKLHRAPVTLEREVLRISTLAENEASLKKSVDRNTISPSDAAWFAKFIAKLEPAYESPFTPVLVHNDLHPWNLLADPETLDLTAVLDWGDAGVGDPALDLNGFPAWAMHRLGKVYREDGGVSDEFLEGRALCEWISVLLWEGRELQEGEFKRFWWRWPAGGVEEIIGFFEGADDRWRQWLP